MDLGIKRMGRIFAKICKYQLFFVFLRQIQLALISLTQYHTLHNPNLYIIAGPNGAGKTTASYTLLPEILNCYNFVNADEIARGLSPFAPALVDIQAARIMLNRIEELLMMGVDFAIETTLASRSYVGFIRRAQSLGYKVELVFFYLESPEQAIRRVAQRVSQGGHNIPEEVIRRRFSAGLHNLTHLYLPICDSMLVFNNTEGEPHLLAELESSSHKLHIHDAEAWAKITQL